jgi:hypothetical protein
MNFASTRPITQISGNSNQRDCILHARLVMPYLKERWRHFRECWEHAPHHRAVTVVAAIALGLSLYSEYVVPFVDVPSLDPKHKLPLSWALVIALGCTLFIVLEGSYRLQYGVRITGFSENDPKIVPECRWTAVAFDERIFQERPITIVNLGGSDAKDIQIAPIVTPNGRAEFKPIGYLAKGKAENILPDMEGITVNGVADIVDLLDREWQFPKNADPIRKPISIQYSASVGKERFMSTGIIVRDPNKGTTESHSLNFRKVPQAAS